MADQQAWGGNAPKGTTAATRRYRILRSSYTRFEGDGQSRRAIHYRAGANDIVEMTDKQADKFGRRWLVEISPGGIEKPSAEQAKYMETMAKVQANADAKAAKLAKKVEDVA